MVSEKLGEKSCKKAINAVKIKRYLPTDHEYGTDRHSRAGAVSPGMQPT